MITMTATRVEFDDCEYSDAQELLHAGEPYTGVVVETAAGGRLVSEQSFKRGIPDGLSRVWFDNGQLSKETAFEFGIRQRLRQWHRNGQLLRDVVYGDRGKVLSDSAWDERGRPVDATS
jgi:antitoxin component YwqK of YwqJK toxin-antitoxin module